MSANEQTKHLIVYADDDPDDLLLVSDALVPYEERVDVCIFNGGGEAYTFLLDLEKRGEKPCLIILDMNMPGMGAKELLPALRSFPFYEDVPIVLFTTSSMQHDYHFALKYNAGFITKPMTLGQMESIAEQFLSYCAGETREQLKQ